MRTIFIIIALLIPAATFGNNTCSRVAVINLQEVLVDTNSTQKGEGLRYHLEKDPVAKMYLDLYQEGTSVKLETAILGTVGSGMILTGVLSRGEKKTRQTLVVGGITTLLVNFLVAKTLEYQNEENLYRAVDEYNKRNLPRIDILRPQHQNSAPDSVQGFFINKSWSF